MDKQETVLVPFSGGIDSFYIAYQELMKGNTVHTSYVNMFNNHTKSKAEKTVRSFWTGWLKEVFPDTYMDFPNLSDINTSSIGGSFVLVQPVMWLILARPPRDYDRVVMGAIIGDDPLSWKEELTQLHSALAGLSEHKTGELDWGYSKTSKSSIWSYLKGLSEHANCKLDYRPWVNFWTCETPEVREIKEVSGRDWSNHPNHPKILINKRRARLAVTPSTANDEEPYALIECGKCLKCHEDNRRRKPTRADTSKMVIPKKTKGKTK